MAAAVVVLALMLVMARPSSASFCVCKDGSSDALQKAIDYACGNGADCNPIRSSGACYNPNNIKSHCSYAVNSYYQKKSTSGATCDFNGVAVLTNSDPSGSGCSYPSSSSAAGSSSSSTSTSTPTVTSPSSTASGTTTVTPVSGSTTPTGTSSTSPYTGTSTPTSGTGVLGGVGTGLAPTGMGMNADSSHVVQLRTGSSILLAVAAGAVFLWC